jgi:hypothetical protein
MRFDYADIARIRSADKSMTTFERAGRRERRNIKRRLEEAEKNEEDIQLMELGLREFI